MKYLLDTNIFNRLLDGAMSLADLPSSESFIVTNVQLRELEATSNSDRRNELLRVFHEVAPESVLTESFAFNIPGSGFNEAKWSSDGGMRVASLRAGLDSHKYKPNNVHDAIIAEVALVNGYGLATTDRVLAVVAREHGIHVHQPET